MNSNILYKRQKLNRFQQQDNDLYRSNQYLNVIEQMKIMFSNFLNTIKYQSRKFIITYFFSILDVHTVQTIHDLGQGKGQCQL